MPTQPPSVFISYSHDDQTHEGRVLALADSLELNGVPVILDRYEPCPERGWPRWMEDNLDQAGFVLLICTETYYRRVRGKEEAGKGLGVGWESNLIYNRIFNDPAGGSRYIPIMLEGGNPSHIPTPLKGHTYYSVKQFDFSDKGYEDLYRHLTKQPEVVRPTLGSIKILAAKNLPPVTPVAPVTPITPVSLAHADVIQHEPVTKHVPVSKHMPFMEDAHQGKICITCNDRTQLGADTAHKMFSKVPLIQRGEAIPRCEINGTEYPLAWGETICIRVETGKAHTFLVYTDQPIWGRQREAEFTTAVVESGKVQSFQYKVSLGLSWTGVVAKILPLD